MAKRNESKRQIDDERLSELIGGVSRLAAIRQDAYLLPEHILLSLCDMPRFAEMCSFLGANADAIRAATSISLDGVEKVSSPQDVVITRDYLDVVANAARMHEMAGVSGFEPAIVALALLDLEDSVASFALQMGGVDKAGIGRFLVASRPGAKRGKTVNAKAPGNLEAPKPIAYAEDMTAAAAKGKYPPLVGRERELADLIRILHKKRGCNPLLIGDSGVGKTAIAEGLAARLATGAVPASLAGCRLLRLDLAGMLAGAKLRGDFEERLEKAVAEISADPKALVFIDEIHTACGAGSGGDAGMDAVALLKPHLTGGAFRCIGATTHEDYRKTIQKDKALARRFRQIEVAEPSPAETVEILKGIRASYAEFHGVEYPDAVLQAIVDLTGRHLKERHFPDKAIEIMDELGAERSSGQRDGKEITPGDVARLVAAAAKIAPIAPGDSERARLIALPTYLKREVFGQDSAIDAIARHLRVAKAGLLAPNRPLGVWGLVGPTGSGKTELARQLAAALGARLIRLDMSEYSGKEDVSKLIGTAPGYVGFDQAGLLTEPVIKHPNCVVLLDEIEKAHPAIHNLLLQTLDEGRLTDNTGRTADFTDAVILMTSNVGAREAEAAKGGIGFGESAPDSAGAYDDALKAAFPPEFRNRLTGTLRFAPLDAKTLGRVAEKAIRHLNDRLADRGCWVVASEAAIAHIAEAAAAEKMGGRPVERLVNALIAEPLAEMLLGEEPPKGEIAADWREGEMRLALPALAECAVEKGI